MIMVTSFKRSHASTVTLSAPNLAAGHHRPTSLRRLLAIHRQSGSVSCRVTAPFSWVLVHKVLFVPSKILFPQSCVSSGGSMLGLMVPSSKRAYAIPRSTAPRGPAPAAVHCWLICMSSGDIQIQFCLSLCGVSGSWCIQGMFEPTEHLWWVWDLILNMI